MSEDFFVDEDFTDEVYCWQIKETVLVEDAFPFLKRKDIGCMQCSNYVYCCISSGVRPQSIKD